MADKEPIKAEPTEERQIDAQHFTIQKKDHDKALELLSKILTYQHDHPELYYYTRTRIFFRESPDNPDHEIWMFMDEYDNRAVYLQSLMDAASKDPHSAENMAAWKDLIVPPVPQGHEVWTEAKELRVQFSFREPLYPCS